MKIVAIIASVIVILLGGLFAVYEWYGFDFRTPSGFTAILKESFAQSAMKNCLADISDNEGVNDLRAGILCQCVSDQILLFLERNSPLPVADMMVMAEDPALEEQLKTCIAAVEQQ